MKIIDVEQGSEAWLSWRKTVITATDCPAILGSSPWSTAYKCWQRKLGHLPAQKSNDAMERGRKLEPVIRERFIKKYGINMKPAVVESSEYEFLGASLDGLSECGRYILEVKTGGSSFYKMAKDGNIPQDHLDQMQHQLLVTGAEKCYYQVGHEDEENDAVIEVYPDKQFVKEFLPKAREFWKCVAFNEPPPMQDSDYKDMSNDSDWQRLSHEYRAINEQIKSLEEVKEAYRKELLNLCGDQSCLGGGIKVMKTIVRGRVAYDEIPEIKGVDLDKYRKGSSTTWKILVA
jgi:putative phage-type endonuclease